MFIKTHQMFARSTHYVCYFFPSGKRGTVSMAAPPRLPCLCLASPKSSAILGPRKKSETCPQGACTEVPELTERDGVQPQSSWCSHSCRWLQMACRRLWVGNTSTCGGNGDEYGIVHLRVFSFCSPQQSCLSRAAEAWNCHLP